MLLLIRMIFGVILWFFGDVWGLLWSQGGPKISGYRVRPAHDPRVTRPRSKKCLKNTLKNSTWFWRYGFITRGGRRVGRKIFNLIYDPLTRGSWDGPRCGPNYLSQLQLQFSASTSTPNAEMVWHVFVAFFVLYKSVSGMLFSNLYRSLQKCISIYFFFYRLKF